MRDVFRLFDRRLHLMLDEDDPTFANWDQDETAVADRYGEQDPATVVGDQLVAAAEAMARRLRCRAPPISTGAPGRAATVPGSRSRRSPAT